MTTPSIDFEALRGARRDIEVSLCRDSFADFVRLGWHELEPNGRPFVDNPGTDAIIQHLQAVGDGKIRRLGIAVSPGFGKTTLASVAFPAWMWARDPAWRVICASHAYELAGQIARKFLHLVTSDWYQTSFGIELESDAIKSIETTRSGKRHAVGVTGALTGLRANAGIIDDSLNAIDANSKLAINEVNDWYDAGFSTRFDDGDRAPIIVIQQKLAENDLLGHLRELGGFEMLELPARFETGRRCVTSIWSDPRTKEGEVLAPEIHSEAFLDEQLRVLRPHGFAAQYQQRPAPREGNQFKIGMWSYCSLRSDVPSPSRMIGARKDPPHVIGRRPDSSLDLDVLCVTVDATGGSLAQDASALGLLVYGRKAQRRFVIHDADPGPRTFLQTVADIKAALLVGVELAGYQPKIVVLVEKKALGQGAIEKIAKSLADGELRYSDGRAIVAKVEPFEPQGRGDKVQRAAAMEPDVDAGLVHLLDGASWVPAFIEEFALFPRGARDDRVDALSQAEIHFTNASDVRARWKALGRIGGRASTG